MSEMIERIVEGIRGSVYESDDIADHMHQEAALRAVRYILNAMREPTEAMLAEAWVRRSSFEDHATPQQVSKAIWQAMIDAALAPPPGDGER